MKRLLIALILTGALTGCSDDERFFSPDEVGVPVVDARLLVDAPFPTVLVSRTARPDEAYSFAAVTETGATVTITRGDGDVLAFEHSGFGRYEPVDSLAVVLPSTTYRLRVETAAGEIVTATTTTPKRLSVDRWVLVTGEGGGVIRELETFDAHGDSLYSRPNNILAYTVGLLEARFERGGFVAFQIGLSSIDEGSDFIIDPDFFDDEDFDDLDRNTSSPPLDITDGSVTLPWFAIFFEGRHVTRLFAIDRNWYDLARSLPDLGGGNTGFGGNAGDTFERPLFNVDGGIGLFGSASVDSVGFTVVPVD